MNLYPHQIEMLRETENLNRVAYYLDMGLGKTFIGAEKMQQLGNQVNLLICQKSKIDDWMKHFQEYYPDCAALNLTKKEEMADFFYMYQHCSQFNPFVGIINYDLVFRRPELLKLDFFTLMLDESSLIQNETAKRTKFILRLNPDNVILLSGTPTSGKYENLWSQIHLLGWDISSKLYNRQYVNWERIEAGEDFGFWTVNKEEPYKNVDRLKSKLREHGAVFLKTDESFDRFGYPKLPEQMPPIIIKVPTTKAYRTFRKNGFVTVNTIVNDQYGNATNQKIELVGDTTFTQRLYARMLCGQYNKDKLQAFKDLAMSTNDRLIVFYNFNEELAALQRIISTLERPISLMNGSVKNLNAYEWYDDSITLVQYQVGAMGLDYQKANKMVFFTLTDKSELFEQAKKRTHRIGQERPCFYYLLLCENSIEEVMLDTLNQRKDFTDDLFRECEV